jgi:hypothetical protein
MSWKPAADRLFVAENHDQEPRRPDPGKLDLRDRVQAVVLAYETGLVRPSPSVEQSLRASGKTNADSPQAPTETDDTSTGSRLRTGAPTLPGLPASRPPALHRD